MRAAMELQVKGLFKEGDVANGQKREKVAKAGKSSSKMTKSELKLKESGLCGKEEDSKGALTDLIKRITKEKTTREDLAENRKQKTAALPLLKDAKDSFRSLKREVEVKKKKQGTGGQIEKENLVDLATIEDVKKDESGKYPCPYCEFKNRDLCALRKHLTSHEDVKFTCMWKGCDQKYSNIDSRKRHEKKAHGEVRGDDFECDKCESRFALPDNLKKHIVDAHSLEKL